MNQNSQQVATVEEPRMIDIFKQQLDKAAPMIMPLLPSHITADKFKSMVITTVAFNPKLQECSLPSLLESVATLAALGLSTNPVLKEADILPVWSKNGTVAQARPRAIGLMKLARQSKVIIDIYAHEVYENDEFSYEYGLNKHLTHRPATGDRGALTFAYVVWESSDRVKGFEVVDNKRISRAKEASEGYKAFKAGKIKKTPWVDDEGEMWRKTAVIAGSKYMPRSTETDQFQKALALSSDANFDDDAPRIAPHDPDVSLPPPRPTRASVAQAAAIEPEEAEAANRAMDAQYAATMNGRIPDDPEVDAGEVEPEAENPTISQPEPGAIEPDDEPAHDYAAVRKEIEGKLLKAGKPDAIDALAATYASVLQMMKTNAPEMARELSATFAARRKKLES